MAEKKQSKIQAAKSHATARAHAAKEKAAAVKGAGSKHAGGFAEFIRTQGVIGLAVGLAIGTAAGDTVKKLVEGFINPVVQFIVGSQEGLQAAVWHFEAFGRSADFAWGAFVSSAITLLATALVIYWLVHILKLDRLDKKKD
ncbi:MscL family protein [Candidatus Saccharibacteria bacterium]|nr:MscL family protein [Candidatus Saccharibacteria bacterium]MBH1973143.1 MscL family protein [Candidatus Saccharibacteria bacterium]MBH1990615.1 MscL family protein [Candidatus Saccharibacteria bacterium]